MHTAVKPLPVQDILSVFMDVSPAVSFCDHVLVELLTAEGLLILRVPQPMARELSESLLRASSEGSPLQDRRSLDDQLQASEIASEDPGNP